MTPYLITAPVIMPVELADMKAHLHVDPDDDDASIVGYQAGAVAVLDAWGGVLGRCIMPQTWAVDVTGPGPHLLPFPDASDIRAESNGVAVAFDVSRTGLGQIVTLPDTMKGQKITIQASYALPPELLPAAQMLVKLMVSRDYDAPYGAIHDALSRRIQSHIKVLRWWRV